MKVTRGYKTELRPNVKQAILLYQFAGAARFAYNYGLARKKEVSAESGKRISSIDLMKELTARKHTDLPWLKNVSKWVYQNALRDLDEGMNHFFRRVRERKSGKKNHQKLGFPVFKKKSQGIGSFRLDSPISVQEDRLQLPKLGTIRLKERSYIPTSGVKVLSATLSEEAGRWYVAVLVEEEVPEMVPASGPPSGVDLGIATLATVSDGRKIDNPKALSTNLKRLKRAQRHLSRCHKGSANRGKAKAKVSRLHARIAHIRADALHQATSSLVHAPLSASERSHLKTRLTADLPEAKTKPEQKKVKKQVKARLHQTTEQNAPKRPQVICLEDLNVEGMKQNRKLARAISDVGMGEFRRQMTYKSLWNGEHLIFADRFFPSSKQCHCCGWKWEEMTLSDRLFVCQNPACPLSLVKQDRDGNASQNLENEAKKELAQSTGSYSGLKMPVDGRSTTWGGTFPGNSTG
jgi:putative transposase